MTRFAANSVIACPHCRYLALKRNIASFSTGDITRWSDGYASSWFGQPSFTRCGSCQGVFWLEDATYVGEMPRQDERHASKRPRWVSRFFGAKALHDAQKTLVPDAWHWAQSIAPPDVDALIIGIETLGDAQKEREQRIRRLLWWKLNNRHRRKEHTAPSVSQTILEKHEESNLLRLLELSDENGRPTLERIEIYRELRRFSEAQAALASFPEDTPGTEILAAKIAERDSRVCILEESDWNR